MSNSALFLVVLITAVVLVGAALLIALWLAPRSTAIAFVGIVIALSKAISPRSYNPQKMEAYECGIPTRGTSWMQFRVGYYLFAILYLVFDVETVLLFPWATVMRDLGPEGLESVLFFFIILALGLAYAWKKGALKWK